MSTFPNNTFFSDNSSGSDNNPFSDNTSGSDNDPLSNNTSESDNTPFSNNTSQNYYDPSHLTNESLRDLLSETCRGLWTICENCNSFIFVKHLKENNQVCYSCSYHHPMSSQERIDHLLDAGSWRPLNQDLSPLDPLEFLDQKNYTERLEEAQERTGLQDAIQTGTGKLDTIPIAFGVMDFGFMGGSMGSVVGEKITRLIEYATKEGLTLLLVCSSGGARMQEGILSLMQMAKISAALQVYQSSAKLLYISLLTTPTTGGVTASFAMLGNVIVAEPKALIGFAGRRVIEQTLQEELPPDFQTAEYLLQHGLLDLIVKRRFLRQAFSEVINFFHEAPFKWTGTIPQQLSQKEKGIENLKGAKKEEGVEELEKREGAENDEDIEKGEGAEKDEEIEEIKKGEEAEQDEGLETIEPKKKKKYLKLKKEIKQKVDETRKVLQKEIELVIKENKTKQEEEETKEIKSKLQKSVDEILRITKEISKLSKKRSE